MGKRVRKYYKLSAAGKGRSRERVSELAEFMETMKLLLDIQPKSA
jgi:hypothetical protein